MRTTNLYFKSAIVLLVFSFIILIAAAQMPLSNRQTDASCIGISKENLRLILSDNNQKQTCSLMFKGQIDFKDNIKSDESVAVIQPDRNEINAIKKNIIVDLTNSIIGFRKFLELNNIEYIYADSIKIKTANLMTQEEAKAYAATLIDENPMPFRVEYNDTTRKECYLFRLSYYKSKLLVSMGNYSESLLNGYIDELQMLIEETKIKLSKFN